ncbi:endonuclease domain-containing protein [Paludisphaera borealis]|uniref:DUF559 domain-containing protein n=1 Tax=Paludisphaera borealis TaxID=1387353 RepID=A0A1U7CRV4_9BACT|nr:DUF559 domain-containing protein [Paludisphaera borealis]APW61680.1 hypothetical protein BSF38_03205 [Paludisphaera borealis]
MTTVYADELDRLLLPPASRTRVVFAARGLVGAVGVGLEARAVASGGGIRLVAIRFDRPPPLKALIDDMVDQLAAVALGLFPDWYGDDARFAAVDAQTADFDAILADRLDRLDLLRRGVSVPWLKAARRLCRRGGLPRPRGFPASVHAAQLARAVDPSPLLIALLLDDDRPAVEALHGLSRASEWLAREAGARVVLIVPDALEASTALDGVSFEAVRVREREAEETSIDVIAPAFATAAPRLSVSPLIGRPNPASRGELLLARRLERDENLAGLFRYNVHVETRRGTSPLVDLVWESGKIVVEVDGFYYHSDASAFSRDRRRDYELTTSGYLVLRMPEDEVVGDVELAVEKVRDLVEFRRVSDRSARRTGINDAT